MEIINNVIYYKGVYTGLTREDVQDYIINTGMDPIDIVILFYNKNISVIRDKKIDEILS